jgi:hypothetical protein
VVTDTGEKILPGSRRPDGTIRKERRVRAGYVPQDEQPVYQTNEVMVSVTVSCSLAQKTANTSMLSAAVAVPKLRVREPPNLLQLLESHISGSSAQSFTCVAAYGLPQSRRNIPKCPGLDPERE